MNRKVTFSGRFNKDANVIVPSSKSYIHRMAICAALAEGKSRITNVNFSDDINATLQCLQSMGCKVDVSGSNIEITGGIYTDRLNTYNCNESASTLRFMIPVVLSSVGKGKFIGSSTLLKRPLNTYIDLFDDNGINYEYVQGEYFVADGKFDKDLYRLGGNVSSQFITGMLLALARTGGRKKIEIIGQLTSAPYVNITREVMKEYGVKTDYKDNVFTVNAPNGFVPQNTVAQGDYSQSAFFLVAAMLGGRITLKNLKEKTSQGDAVIVDLIRKMGGKITRCGNDIVAEKSALKSLGTVDAQHFPDIVPPLALLCTQCEGDTVLTNVNRLKIKECDRLLATEKLLKDLGAEVKTDDNNIYIKGGQKLHGNTVSSFNDHRIAMTAAVASVVTDGSVIIEESESVKKSYPRFFEDFERLGGICVE